MTDTAKLRKALEGVDDVLRFSTGLLINARSPVLDAAREYLALLESSDIILIRREEGEWPQWVKDAFSPGPKGYSSLTWDAILDRLLVALDVS